MRRKVEFRVTCEDGNIDAIKQALGDYNYIIEKWKNKPSWYEDTPENIWGSFLFCLMSRQVQVDVVENAFDLLTKEGFCDLKKVVEPDIIKSIQTILRTAGHRFANIVAENIVSAAEWIHENHSNVKKYIESIVNKFNGDEYKIRDDLREFDGIGWKIASFL